jgi:oxygen-independent coproporphyrinogen-3 oxidase
VSDSELIGPETALSERILLGLRIKDGIDLDEVASETGAPGFSAERERAVARLCRLGRLEREGNRLRIPASAWLFSDAVVRELF